MTQKDYFIGTGKEFGYVRRTDLDTEKCDTWESPSGQMLAMEKGKPLMLVRQLTPFSYAKDA